MTEMLDATGLKCPLPVLRAQKALKSVTAGDVLMVRADDPAARKDFPAFCEAAGHVLRAVREDGEVAIYEIEKAG